MGDVPFAQRNQLEVEPRRGILLFVYGTMMSCGRNHVRLYECRAIRIGDKYLTGDLFEMYLRAKNGAPCAVPANPHGFPIEGEFYAVPAEAIAIIEAAEGSPEVYQRKPVYLRGFRGAPAEINHYIKPINSDSVDDEPIEPNAGRVLQYGR
jgi:gamma-glutamylcyclotransferase (GGCT)/AIG2-like uncharacterized protein YtfP